MQAREEAIKNLLTRNVADIIERDHLRKALVGGKKLRIKHGIDPTGPLIHIGRAVVLRKLKEFQDLGHKIVLVIGDFTAQIGDPSDKLEKRPFLTPSQIQKNLKNYLPQIGKILDLKKCEVRYNSEWLAKLNFREISQLADIFTVQQTIERRNFKERFKKGVEITLREFLYPVMQGYDSVAIKAHVELGGTDQLFNLLAGRKIQERYKQEPQDIMTTKMLVGTDGQKMSTSWGNVINIIDPPSEQYGKVMSSNDAVIREYFELATNLAEEEIEELMRGLARGVNPKTLKERLAFEIVKLYHGEKSAQKAQADFETLFSRHAIPADLPEIRLGKKEFTALELVFAAGTVTSKSEARRLIEQGGVDVNGATVKDPNEKLVLESGGVIKIGKKNFFRVK